MNDSGKATSQKAIPLCKAFVDDRELAAVAEVLRSGWLTHGPKNGEFERLLAETVGVRHAIALNSCTSALQLALLAHGISGEVILPSFTFMASANSVVTSGATPVFADIEFDTCNIDPDSIERMIGPNTEAIMIVHFAGQCCRMDRIMEIAEKRSLLLIEDSAETIGGDFHGRQAGSFGVGCFSFFPTKIVTTGEGGAMTTHDDMLAAKVRALIGHGTLTTALDREKTRRPWRREAALAGYNYRMSDLLAALGVEQMKKLDTIIALRRRHAAYLNTTLDPELFHLPLEGNGAGHVYQMYTVKLKGGVDRDRFVQELRERGVGASVHFDPPVHRQPFYQDRFGKDRLDVTEAVASSIATLPLYPSLEQDELAYVADTANRLAAEMRCTKER